MSRVLGFLFATLLSGCATPLQPGPHMPANELLDGRALFGEPVSIDEAPAADILHVSPAMQRFLARVRNVGNGRSKLERLMSQMEGEGYLALTYDSGVTLTAEETFQRRTGNCLSYTNLFIALARAQGLDAYYQIVKVPPIWESADDWVILNNHINALVLDVHQAGIRHYDYVVDFNTRDYRGPFERHQITDATAAALFYSNRGAEALRDGNFRNAFANFKRAVANDPKLASVWLNLGSLYSRRGDLDRAAAAYHTAIGVEPSNKPALMSLAQLYDRRGDAQLAEQYRARVRHFEDINPYHHYVLARNAFQAADYDTALVQIRRAIALKKNDHELYFLQGLIEYRIGDLAAARSSFDEAQRYSTDDAIKQRYAEKLAALSGSG